MFDLRAGEFLVRLIALSADVVNRQINTWRPGWNKEQGARRAEIKKRAEKGQNQHNGIEGVKKMREGI